MTLDGIRQRIAAIVAVSDDDEQAHFDDDELREDFVRYIAAQYADCPHLSDMAELILTTNDIRFSRWYA